MKPLTIAVILAAAVMASTARAEPTAHQALAAWDAPHHHAQAVNLFSGIESAYGYSDILLTRAAPGSHLFCQPESLDLNPKAIAHMLRSFLSRHPAMGARPAALVYLAAMQKRFPCAG